MDLQKNRLFLLISLVIVSFALFSEWQKQAPRVEAKNPVQISESHATTREDIPDAAPMLASQSASSVPVSSTSSELIDVTTDVLKIKIDLSGGDLVRAELLDYPVKIDDPSQGVLILDNQSRFSVAQTGLVGRNEKGPDSKTQGRAKYTSNAQQYHLKDNTLDVELFWKNEGIQVKKVYTFTKGSYLVKVKYAIENLTDSPWAGSYYGQLRKTPVSAKSGMLGVQMYEGGALYTPEKQFKKISFSDMKKTPFRQEIEGGWAAMVEHYFLSAYIPDAKSLNHYYTRVDENNVYNIGATSAVNVGPHGHQEVKGEFYVGPEIADNLSAISKGLNLTIDYGILWPISLCLFWLLKTINQFVQNWGWSIILVTLVIKLAFYKLSASSYRSMGKMRLLQPRVELLKERYKDDKQQFSVQLMELYRKEKLNPLGGCLPILVQIPVFIALYYVLLESVELRQAPFILWIKDLSAKDPYYVLPLIMGATMFLQQKMSPPPPDPMQAKVMMLMPIFFTALFVSFPSGLVLYWTANNLLSILQQWYITRSLNTDAKSLKVA